MKEINLEEFEAIYRQYAKLIYGIAYHILFSPQESEEIVQETFIKFSECYHAVEKPKFWLIKVATNLCLNQKKRSKLMDRYQKNVLNSIKTIFVTMVGKLAIQDEAKILMRNLDKKERSLLSLKFVHDLTYREICEILNIPEGTAKVNISRILQKLKVEG